MAKKRSFKKLREHLTSNDVDKKIEYLESRMPTNNTAFVFSGDPSNPQGNSFETITDGEENETDYTVGESPSNSTEARDTTGLFNAGGDHSKGEYVKTVEPPGDTSYILGPMAAMYYTWSYPWTMIGYIRESDRRMVNLGRIDGKFSDWDGSSGNASSGSGTFYSYGQLTTDQALWFRDIQKANGNTNDPDTYSYRAFYPGPPSASPDAFGRYPCILTGVSKKQPRNVPDSTPLDKQAGDNFSAQNARNRRGSGMRNRGRAGVNIPGAQNQRGIGARINTGDPEMDRGLGSLFQRGSQALRGAIQSLSGTLRAIGGRSTGLGGAVELGFHGTSRGAARGIRGTGFRPGSRQNIFGTRGTFVAPSPRQTGGRNLIPQAARDFSRRGGSAGRGAISRALGSKSKTPGSILPVVTPTGSGVRSRIPGTKFAEVGVNQKTANRGLRLGQNIIKGKYPNSAKANQLLKLGKTTNAAKGARGLAKTAGRLAPGVGIALAGIDVAQRGNQARQNFKNGNFAAASLDMAGAGLGALTAIPGPVGWAALAAQATLDIGRAKGVGNRIQGRVSRSNQRNSYDLDGDILLEYELGGYLLVEQDDEDYTIDDEDKEILQGYMSLLVQELRKALPVVGGIDDEDEEFLQNLEAGEIGAPEDLEKIIKILEKLQSGGKDYDDEEEEDEVKEGLSLERKREIFGHLTQPVVLPETKQKTYKVSPGQRFKDKNKKPQETNFQDMDKLFNKNIAGPQPFKPQERTSWTKDFIAQNVMKSQEKMNGVLEMIGDGKHAFDYAMNDYKRMGAKELEQYWGKNPNMYSFLFNGKKYNVTRKEHVEGDLVVFMQDQNGVKSNMLQSELNEKLQEQNEKWIEEAYFKSHPVIPEKKESTYDMIKKRFLENKEIAPEFPKKAPPKMVNGFHPEYGKRADRYKKLDPASANAMPETGDPETDAIVRKQKTINKIKSMKKK